MKQGIFFIILFLILNGCAQYSSMVGPSYTFAKSGSILQAGNSVATSQIFKKTFADQTHSSFNLHVHEQRMCETYHSSNLNEIFFETLDEISCYNDPFSILK